MALPRQSRSAWLWCLGLMAPMLMAGTNPDQAFQTEAPSNTDLAPDVAGNDKVAGNDADQGDHLVSVLARLAAQGDGQAAYYLGMAYHTGTGIARNYPRALAAFRQSLDLGDPLAAYKIGCYHGARR